MAIAGNAFGTGNILVEDDAVLLLAGNASGTGTILVEDDAVLLLEALTVAKSSASTAPEL